MRTRRKSKRAAAAAAEPDNEPAVSVAPLEAASSSRVEFSVPVPDDIDLEYLSRLLPDFSFETPSPDAILSLYRFVVSQAVDFDGSLRDLEESRAEVERKDIELDQALQDRESSVSSFETQIKSLQEELARVKEERRTFGKSVARLRSGYSCCDICYLLYPFSLASSKSNLESQISTLSSSQSISSTELDSFRHRVDDIEREKRDLLGVVSRLKEDSAQRDGVFLFLLSYAYAEKLSLEEIQTLRASLKQARQDQQSLETQLRELRSAESSTKVRYYIIFWLV